MCVTGSQDLLPKGSSHVPRAQSHCACVHAPLGPLHIDWGQKLSFCTSLTLQERLAKLQPLTFAMELHALRSRAACTLSAWLGSSHVASRHHTLVAALDGQAMEVQRGP